MFGFITHLKGTKQLMIVLKKYEVVIFTPPNTKSRPLHEALCDMSGAYWVLGTNSHAIGTPHTTVVPNEFKSYKRALLVRNPYTRMLSLYQKYLRTHQPSTVRPYEFLEYSDHLHRMGWEHEFTIAHWSSGLHFDYFIHAESIKKDLRQFMTRVPRIHENEFDPLDWDKQFRSLGYDRLVELYERILPDLIYGYDKVAISPMKAKILCL